MFVRIQSAGENRIRDEPLSFIKKGLIDQSRLATAAAADIACRAFPKALRSIGHMIFLSVWKNMKYLLISSALPLASLENFVFLAFLDGTHSFYKQKIHKT